MSPEGPEKNSSSLHTISTLKSTRACIDPPLLHIKLSIVNKVQDSLYLIVDALSCNHDLQDSEENVYVNHLAACLSKVLVRTEKYYAGKMSGVPCVYLLKRMNEFCSLFF